MRKPRWLCTISRNDFGLELAAITRMTTLAMIFATFEDGSMLIMPIEDFHRLADTSDRLCHVTDESACKDDSWAQT